MEHTTVAARAGASDGGLLRPCNDADLRHRTVHAPRKSITNPHHNSVCKVEYMPAIDRSPTATRLHHTVVRKRLLLVTQAGVLFALDTLEVLPDHAGFSADNVVQLWDNIVGMVPICIKVDELCI